MNVLVREQTDKLIIAGYYLVQKRGEEDGSRKRMNRQKDSSIQQDRHKIYPLDGNKKDRKADRTS